MFRPELVSFLQLLKRSPAVAGGWRSYSDMMSGLVTLRAREFPGLFEVDEKEHMVRTTAEGDVVVKWMDYTPVKVLDGEK